jgi:hypothetical protein
VAAVKVLFLGLLVLVSVTSGAFAGQLSASGVGTLNPSPISYVFSSTNPNSAITRSVTLTVSSGNLQSAAVAVYCPNRGNLGVTVNVYDSSDSQISTGTNSLSGCRYGHTLTVTLSPAVSMASVAEVDVILS